MYLARDEHKAAVRAAVCRLLPQVSSAVRKPIED